MASRLIWHGDAVLSKVRNASESAINATLADAVAYAQQPGVTPRKSSQLANSLTFEGAKRAGNGLVGSFGSYTVNYAIYVEVGTWKMAGRNYLRRSADAIFPTLADRIKGGV